MAVYYPSVQIDHRSKVTRGTIAHFDALLYLVQCGFVFRPACQSFQLEIENTGKWEFDRINMRVNSAPPQLAWLWLWLQQLIWGIRRLLGWRYWCRQWSSMVSRSYISWVGKKHNCRHFQWQSEGRLLFLYDGQGNMLLIYSIEVNTQYFGVKSKSLFSYTLNELWLRVRKSKLIASIHRIGKARAKNTFELKET